MIGFRLFNHYLFVIIKLINPLKEKKLVISASLGWGQQFIIYLWLIFLQFSIVVLKSSDQKEHEDGKDIRQES